MRLDANDDDDDGAFYARRVEWRGEKGKGKKGHEKMKGREKIRQEGFNMQGTELLCLVCSYHWHHTYTLHSPGCKRWSDTPDQPRWLIPHGLGVSIGSPDKRLIIHRVF
jgi:hypothetical protein